MAASLLVVARSRSGSPECELELNAQFTILEIESIVKMRVKYNPDLELDLFFKGERLTKSQTVGDLGIRNGDVLGFSIAPPRRPGHAISRRDHVSRDIPQPPDFFHKVEHLMDLGEFTREQCETALRAASYNSDKASYYLLTNQIPQSESIEGRRLRGRIEIPVAPRPEKPPEVKTKEDQPVPFEQLPESEKTTLRGLADEYDTDLATVYQFWCISNGDIGNTKELLEEDK
jgi:hypothetical protein